MNAEALKKYECKLPTMCFAGTSMVKSGLPDPTKRLVWYDNKRPKHFFTEKGWKQCGHAVVSEIRSQGLQARIISLKERDPRINILYKDALQVLLTCRS
ncbi:MAG: hypothetical protein WC238_04330 [Parcubacteria group bacterium]|jgi:hypothetical protein